MFVFLVFMWLAENGWFGGEEFEDEPADDQPTELPGRAALRQRGKNARKKQQRQLQQ